MSNLPVLKTTDLEVELLGLAHAHDRAGGPLMRLVNKLGGGIEAQMARLPEGVQTEIERAVSAALIRAHGVAAVGKYAPDLGRNGAKFAAMATGAVGGAAGLAGSLMELPVTITVMLHAIRAEALAAGYDPDDPAVRMTCVEVFAAGSPLHSDDGVNTAFLSARMAVTSGGFQRILAAVVPRLSIVFGEKLALQAVPLIGAVTGAALNAMFLTYYREMARIRFRLLRLAEFHGAEAVLTGFSQAQAKPVLTLKR
jgi:hypothetical protein